MGRFLRIGQELTKIYVEGRDIEEFNIVLHTEGDLRSGNSGRCMQTQIKAEHR